MTFAVTYDSLLGVTNILYSDSTTESFSYNAMGNMVQSTKPPGTTTFTYNSVYQLIEIIYPVLSLISFEYDSNGNRTLQTDSESTKTYTYDNRNRLISETKTTDRIPYTVGNQYDVASRLVYSYDSYDSVGNRISQNSFTYTYNNMNQLLSISNCRSLVRLCWQNAI